MMLIFGLLVFVLGAAIGSFINCTAIRLYTQKSLWGRSECPHCHKLIAWYDNVPILSFISLGARCRHCKKSIDSQYFWLEVISGLLFVAVFLLKINFSEVELKTVLMAANFNWHWLLELIRDWIFVSGLTAVFLMDFKWFVVADEVSLTTAALLLIINLCLGYSWAQLFLAGLVGAGFFAAQYFLSKGAWVGAGDIRIGLLIGFALGWPSVLTALMLSYIIGAIWGIILIVSGKKKFVWKRLFKFEAPSDETIAAAALPFGTFLSVAAIITFYLGEKIVSWYFNLFLT